MFGHTVCGLLCFGFNCTFAISRDVACADSLRSSFNLLTLMTLHPSKWTGWHPTEQPLRSENTQVNVVRKHSGSSGNQRVAGSAPRLPWLHVEVFLSKRLNPKYLLMMMMMEKFSRNPHPSNVLVPWVACTLEKCSMNVSPPNTSDNWWVRT